MISNKKSNVDSFKIKVISGDTFYILSRYNIHKLLLLSKVEIKDTLKIAKELKNYLYKNNIESISEVDLYLRLFEIMKNYNYQKNVEIFKNISTFYEQKVPILILITGPPLSLRSTFTTKLAEYLNISNIISTDLVINFSNIIINDIDYPNKKEYLEPKTILSRRGLNMDLLKCFSDGKPLIIEGDIDLNLFIKNNNMQNNVNYDIINNFINFDNKDPNYDIFEKEKNLLKTINLNLTFTKDLFLNIDYLLDDKLLDPEKKLIKKLKELNINKCIIFPITLAINKKDHYYLIKNKSNYKVKKYLQKNQIKSKNPYKQLLSIYQNINSNLILNKNSIITPVDCNNLFDKSIKELHSIFIKNIINIIK